MKARLLGIEEDLAARSSLLHGEMDEAGSVDERDRIALAHAIAGFDERGAKIRVDDRRHVASARVPSAGLVELELTHRLAETGLGRNDHSITDGEHIRPRGRRDIDPLVGMARRAGSRRAELTM